MGEVTLAGSRVVSLYKQRTRRSENMAREAAELFPSRVTHDVRHLQPYGIYVDRAQGSRKWDLDGNEYIDYFGGHGALLLGHNHPKVQRAVRDALERGTHFGANHPAEIEWAGWIKQLIQSAERVRFTSSGTESTLMALRLARAFTGKKKIVRLMGHFHGWNDHMTSGFSTHFDGSATPGVLPEVASNVVLLPNNTDAELVKRTLSGDPEIAAVILEPTGGHFGQVPLPPEFLADLRRITRELDILLIFDEVVTGFRVAPGGAQGLYDIHPDLTTLAKILAGGLPGGAVAGRQEIMDALDFERAEQTRKEKIQHQGTFNANPLSAAAGISALEIVATTDVCQKANQSGALLRNELNRVFEEEKVSWAAYGGFSGFHLFTNSTNQPLHPRQFDPFSYDLQDLVKNPPGLAHKLRLALLINGVDITPWPGGTVSAVHSKDDIDESVEAFRKAIHLLRQEGDL